jgi:hypothetical protein
MNADLDVELLVAINDAVADLVKAAHEHGPLPSMYSPEFLAAPIEVRQAVLVVAGSSYVFAEEVADSWLDDDYVGGRLHRHHQLPLITELQRKRYPPTGCRETWVRYGPDGPPPDLAVVA